MLRFCNDYECGGHCGPKGTSRKILEIGFYWSHLLEISILYLVADMMLMQGFYYEKRVPFLTEMSIYWERLKEKGPVLVGGLITYMLQCIPNSKEDPIHTILEPTFMRGEKVTDMRV